MFYEDNYELLNTVYSSIMLSLVMSTCYVNIKGHGVNRKSSTTAMEIKALDGIYVEQVAMGMHHTLLLAREETDEEKEKLSDLPEYDPN